MKRFALSLATLLGATSLAGAQSDTEKILKLLDGIDSRLTEMENRLEAIENPVQAQPAAPAPAQPRASVGKAGWRIDVLTYKEGGVNEAPIARFPAPIGRIPLDLHLRDGTMDNWIVYRTRAYFEAKSAGTYTFTTSLHVDQDGSITCETSLTVDGNPVIARFETRRDAKGSGNIELQAATYELVSDTGCWHSGRMRFDSRDFKGLAESHYQIQVLAPEDDAIRDFDGSELYYLARE